MYVTTTSFLLIRAPFDSQPGIAWLHSGIHGAREFPGEDMATSIAPAERPDPISSNLRGFLLLFFVLQCIVLPYYLYGMFDQVRFTSEIPDPSPYTVAYLRFELLLGIPTFVATVIGLFLIIVRDPRTIAWWKTFSSIALAISVAHVWLVRALPHEHFRPISDILVRHGFPGTAIWLAYWTLSSRVKVAFGPHYAQPAVSYAVLGAVTAVATLIVLLVIGAASLA
jgi:hypothetical protein